MAETALSTSPVPASPFTAVVVGGSSGIGKATVKLFLKRGVRVVFGDIDQAKGEAVRDDFRAKGLEQVDFLQVSVHDDTSLVALFKHAHDKYGPVHFAVNTAGITGRMAEVHEVRELDYSSVMKVDLEGVWRFSKAAITYFREQERRLVRHDEGEFWVPVHQRGSLVNVASSIASEGKEMVGVYCAAKHGVVGLTKSMALENAVHGIRVNCISPGLTLTPLFQTPGFDFERAQVDFLSEQPMTRFAHPDEIASAIVFTAMDGASFMTGCDWGPDGGSHVI